MEVKEDVCRLIEARPKTQNTALPTMPSKIVPIHHGWKFRQVGDDKAKWMPVSQFPTNVHLDLIHNKMIVNPFLAKNEEAVQWVGEKSWAYRTAFSSPLLSPGQKAVIAFDGLDTHASVFLNGKEVLKTQDMFIPERLDVTKFLRTLAKNELEIIFESTYLVGKRSVEDHPNHKYGCWNGTPSILTIGECCFCKLVQPFS